jgi:hypothetical protein
MSFVWIFDTPEGDFMATDEEIQAILADMEKQIESQTAVEE